MRKYYKEIFSYIKKNAFDKDLAQDITQETFTRLIKKENTVNIENKRALLYRIAKNVMVDLYREKTKIQKISYEEEEYYDKTSTEEEILEQEQNIRLMKKIEKLPKKRRQAFTLHLIDGYSRQEVANIMGISFNAVEQHISRASNQIKEDLAKEEDKDFE